LDITKSLQYCSLSLYVSARIVSSDSAFEILFEFRRAADAGAHNTVREKLMGRLEGKSVVITGAGSGIGRAASVLFSREGAKLVIVDKTDAVKETAKLVSDAGGTIEAVMADAGSEADVKAFIDKAVAKYGRLDAIWANAGVSGGLVSLPDQTPEMWTEILRVNLIGPFLAIKHSIPHMTKQGHGSIICTASVAGLKSGASGHPYGASKAGVNLLVKQLATEWGARGVTVNAVAPGFIVTDMTAHTAQRLGVDFEDMQKAAATTIPVGRVGRPEDIAHTVSYLVSDGASFVSGQVIYVAGGPKD
jgi:NAD(P)-dependent dehydrogenase (short-subunit alcohol dehydrogenase family)